MTFISEKIMVEQIKESDYFTRLKQNSQIFEEVEGFFGVPDLVVITPDRTFAYEAKLSNWKRALYQAFRYKAFSDAAFVIMDNDKIKPALSQLDRFCKPNVGLLSINNSGDILTHYSPFNETPFSHQLDRKFKRKFRGNMGWDNK